MTVPHLNFEELKSLLKEDGFEIVSDSDWETHNRIMFGKDGHTFPIQIQPTYFYPFVI